MSEEGIRNVGRALRLARIVIPLAAFGFLLWLSQSFENCLHAIPQYKGGQQYEEGLTFLLLFGSRYVGCVGVYLDHNAGAIAAFATVVIAVYTYTLWHVGSGQLGAILRQIELARKEFDATHRPRIILREAFIGTYTGGEEINVNFVLANVGETEGRIVRSVFDVDLVRNESRFLGCTSVEPFNELGRELTIGPGMAILLRYDTLQKRQDAPPPPKYDKGLLALKQKPIINEFGQTVRDFYRDATVHFYGQFLYIDDSRIIRRTAFRRELMPERQRFYRLEGEPDLDYSD
jgi:hypothetical protein